eukprot:10950844-Heterocapsa_arctica.AAC.1
MARSQATQRKQALAPPSLHHLGCHVIDDKPVSSPMVGGAYSHGQWTTPLTSEDASRHRSAVVG